MVRKILFIIIGCIFFLFLFSGCLTCDILYDLGNKARDYDYNNAEDTSRCCLLEFKIATTQRDFYSTDTLYPRLLYEFEVHTSSFPAIKLNSFSFSRKKDGVEPIPYRAYMYSYQLHTYTPLDIPYAIPDSLHGESGSIVIVIESSESYYQTKKLYVNYDIEVGDLYIVKKNIKYRRRLYFDWRPKLF